MEKTLAPAIADRRLFEGGPAAVIVEPPPIVESPRVPHPIEPAPAPFPERFPLDEPSEPDRHPTPLPRPIFP